jgi:hypothetical protein|tara:strand:- start:884 stop:1222 length:339 start_codon:yes stop_codon:yes gene_type:complete
MAVYVSNITIEQGFDFDTSFQLEDTRTNEFLDLTGASTSGMLRKHSASKTNVAFATTISNAETGIISISLTASNTVNLKPGRYVYDIKILTVNGREYKAIEGSALVRSGVTR